MVSVLSFWGAVTETVKIDLVKTVLVTVAWLIVMVSCSCFLLQYGFLAVNLTFVLIVTLGA